MLSLSNAARNIEEAKGLVEAGGFFSFCSIFSQTVTERERDRGLVQLALTVARADMLRLSCLTDSLALRAAWPPSSTAHQSSLTGTQPGAGRDLTEQKYGNYGEERWNIINASKHSATSIYFATVRLSSALSSPYQVIAITSLLCFCPPSSLCITLYCIIPPASPDCVL